MVFEELYFTIPILLYVYNLPDFLYVEIDQTLSMVFIVPKIVQDSFTVL
jgi:hypothetical protein